MSRPFLSSPGGTALRSVLILSLALGVSACGQVKEELGMTRVTPDEFKVTTNQPLTVPPDFRLPSPDPDARPSNGLSPTERAHMALTGRPPSEVAPTQGEAALMRQTGADQVAPGIRGQIREENEDLYDDNRLLLDRLVRGEEDGPDGEVIDAAAERERIREAEQANEPLTGSGVPVVRNRNSGLVEF